jgi:hypothetical protein
VVFDFPMLECLSAKLKDCVLQNLKDCVHCVLQNPTLRNHDSRLPPTPKAASDLRRMVEGPEAVVAALLLLAKQLARLPSEA